MHTLKILALSVPTTICLASCAKSGQEVIIESCIDENTTAVFCECLAETLETQLPETTFEKIVDGLRKSELSREEVVQGLSPTDQVQVMMTTPSILACPSE